MITMLFANAVLLLFAVDALLSLGALAAPGLRATQAAVAAVVGVLVALSGLGMLLRRRLPVSVFGPLLAFIVWASLAAMPLPLWLGLSRLHVGLAIAQAAVIVGVLVRVAALEGVPWFRPEGSLRNAPSLSWRMWLVRALGMLAGAAVGVGLYLSWSVSAFSHGFVGIGADGVWVAHREYARDLQRVHLVAMIHVGDEDRYPELLEGIDPSDAIVLTEGVSDLAESIGAFSYDRLAGQLSLSQQGEIEDLTEIPTRNADVDVSVFSEQTRSLLRQISQKLQSDSPVAMLQSLDADAAAIDQLMADIVDLRNDHLLTEIDAALDETRVVVVPWGAYHFVDVAPAVEARGFTLVSEERLTLIPFF